MTAFVIYQSSLISESSPCNLESPFYTEDSGGCGAAYLGRSDTGQLTGIAIPGGIDQTLCGARGDSARADF